MSTRGEKNRDDERTSGAEELGVEHERLLDPEDGQMAPDDLDEPPVVIRISESLARQMRKSKGWTFPKRIRF